MDKSFADDLANQEKRPVGSSDNDFTSFAVQSERSKTEYAGGSMDHR